MRLFLWMSVWMVCKPSILKCSFQICWFDLRRSMQPRMLSVHFFRTGKKLLKRPSVVSGGSFLTELIWIKCSRVAEHASCSLLRTGYLLAESKGRLYLGAEIQLIGIASKALRCQGNNLRFSRQTALWRLNRLVAGSEWNEAQPLDGGT